MSSRRSGRFPSQRPGVYRRRRTNTGRVMSNGQLYPDATSGFLVWTTDDRERRRLAIQNGVIRRRERIARAQASTILYRLNRSQPPEIVEKIIKYLNYQGRWMSRDLLARMRHRGLR